MADWFTVIISFFALITAGAALTVAIRNANAADTSAIEAGRSADASNRSADAAEDSSRHAASSAESARQVARAELEREHRELRPAKPAMPAAVVLRRNSEGKKSNRFFTFTPARTYRVHGEVIRDGAAGPLDIGVRVEAGVPVEAFLDERGGVQAEAIRVRFWPMVEGDPGEYWYCACDRPAMQGEIPHWEWYLEIPKRPGPATAVF